MGPITSLAAKSLSKKNFGIGAQKSDGKKDVKRTVSTAASREANIVTLC